MYKKLPFQLGKPTTITIQRFDKATVVKGYVVKDTTPLELTIEALVTPVIRTTNLAFLPDSFREKKVLRMFSNTELYMEEEQGTDREGDEFTWENQRWRVIKCAPWHVNGYEAFEAYAYKIDTEYLA
jgi:hypothetical protein